MQGKGTMVIEAKGEGAETGPMKEDYKHGA